MVLALTSQQITDISAHAERVYPEECCGLMLGAINRLAGGNVEKAVAELVALENKWEPQWTPSDALPESSEAQPTKPTRLSSEPYTEPHTKHRRYTIDPIDMLRVQKQARDRGLSIIGIYHSHPDHVANPSECDRAQAWPDYAYTIVSVRSGKAVDVKNWALDSDHQFQPEAIQAAPSSATDRMPVSA